MNPVVEKALFEFVVANVVTRRELETLVGRDEVVRLIAAGQLVDNPITERMELVVPAEEFY